ncbi:MAG: galactokinase [Lachnospiraceae bacterium]|nr:galactokinase [Lachnospiraceae bacterium]
MSRKKTLREIYGEDFEKELALYQTLKEWFRESFGKKPESFYRAPGRVEIGGNHTDHQGGVTLSAATGLDMIAAVAPRRDNEIYLLSEGYGRLSLTLTDTGMREEEKGQTAALLRGMAASFRKNNKLPEEAGGMEIALISRVPAGMGFSSSASFELLLGTIFNHQWKAGLEEGELARMAQETENAYFGKPCGLLDQLSCALGGILSVDFSGREPWVRRIKTDLSRSGIRMFMVLSGNSHKDLTEEYAAIPRECGQVAAYFGQERLCQVPEASFWEALPDLRKACGDRAVLRSAHVFEENRRALSEAMCLLKGNYDGFLKLVRESGRSSAMYLQNLVPGHSPEQQDMLVTMALCEHVLRGRGAVRVHGGGFGGSLQVFVPQELAQEFENQMEAFHRTVLSVSISPLGGTGVDYS